MLLISLWLCCRIGTGGHCRTAGRLALSRCLFSGLQRVLPRHGADRHAGADLLQAIDNDLIPSLQAGLNHPAPPMSTPNLHRPYRDLAVLADNHDAIALPAAT